jgi:CRP/FNR family transcriptional regulator/CRP/FNR family cyclic AMP-dependent transcriptional regulator
LSIEPSRAPHDRADQLIAIQRHGFLGRLSPEHAADLIRSAPLVHYPAGRASPAGRGSPWAVIVASGLVRQFLPSANGRQVTIGYARAGDLICSSFDANPPANVEIEAVEASELLHVDAVRLERMARLEPELAMALVEELSHRLRRAYLTLAGNTFATVRTRVARDLLERAVEAEAQPPRAHVRVTQQGLADATGSVREVVTRAMREMRLQGLIQTDQSWITILDRDGLIREAGQSD